MRRKLDNIPIKTNVEQILEKLRISEKEDIEIVSELFEKAKNIACPKVLYKESYVEKITGNNIWIDSISFQSNVVAKNLKDIHRVFAYVATCGTEVDDWSHGEKDYIVSLWLDMIKEMFLLDTLAYFKDYIKKSYRFEKLSSVNPGSGNADNWNISQQVQLFELIGDVEEEIGVGLTSSFLMYPIKSTSGLLYQSETEFVNCALCNRENCVGRRVEFDSELYIETFS